MLFKKVSIACIFTLLLIAVVTACGGNSTDSSNQLVSDTQTYEQDLPKADPNATVDSLLGSWTDINSSDRFTNITKTDNEIQYQDNEATYPATFKDGVLKVQVSSTDNADVYFDATSGHMFAIYQGNPSEFEKK